MLSKLPLVTTGPTVVIKLYVVTKPLSAVTNLCPGSPNLHAMERNHVDVIQLLQEAGEKE